MSDLISRSALIECFDKKGVEITFDLPVEEVLGENVDMDDFAMLVQDAIQAYKKMVIDTIKNQPAAYDVEKTIGQLKDKSFVDVDEHYADNGICLIFVSDALEIVRKGGRE